MATTIPVKGYEMIVLVNGFIFLAIGLLAHFDGVVLASQGGTCPGGNLTQCANQQVVGRTTQRLAPFVVAVGVVLLGLGASLVLHRRWYGKGPEVPDEGPGYP